ncbi:hypothetical protein [Streptomyces cyaneofuscatus]|uniref:hypothetical protein n=1 Tax=Streptomyces cyaneofuscatus TaxID=66883 RepID=UPI0033AD03F9
MKCEREKSELAVYAMAAIGPVDADRIGAHVAGCLSCAAELDEILATLSALRQVPTGELLGDWEDRLPDLREAAVQAAMADHAFDETAPEAVAAAVPAAGTAPAPPPVAVPVKGGGRPRRWNWALAAAVAGVGLGFGGSLVLAADEQPQTALARPSGPSTIRSAGADGVTAVLQPKDTGWGTEVLLELSGVDGPKRCALVVVGRDGTEETALTWQVPDGGYGLPGSPKERLLAVGGVGIPADEITGYVIRTTDGKELLSATARPGSA